MTQFSSRNKYNYRRFCQANQRSSYNKRLIKGYQEAQTEKSSSSRSHHPSQQQLHGKPAAAAASYYSPTVLRLSETRERKSKSLAIFIRVSISAREPVHNGYAGEERAERQRCEGLAEEELDSNRNHHLGDTGWDERVHVAWACSHFSASYISLHCALSHLIPLIMYVHLYCFVIVRLHDGSTLLLWYQ